MNRWLVLALVGGLGGLLYLLAPMLTPFVGGALVAYLADPWVDRLERVGLRRLPAVILVFSFIVLLFVSLLLLVLPVLAEQVGGFIDDLPAFFRWLQKHFGVKVRLGNLEQVAATLSAYWQKVGGDAAAVLESLTHSGAVIVSWVLNLALIPVVVFYLLRDWNVMLGHIRGLLPRRWVPGTARLVGEVDGVLSAVFRGQFMVMIALGAIYSLGLWLIGLKQGLLIGLIAGLVSFIPYAGAMAGVTLAAIAALAQYGEFSSVISVLVVFGVGHLLEGMWLTPWLIGHRIGLHPVAVIFAVLAGGQLFGFLGVLLALPLAAVVMVLLRHIHGLYKDSDWYGIGSAPPDGE
ncbi:Predicted PurR-regulated permease PerM [Methylomagnum ishizawai]|uniref:Predicted PurR-regulated permease PerM n=1 Tax=Methylomagnum ishizawai TaxID=1760988 RepID=A0A1Y6D7A8_9GAMM|nr:AI-2E family transporter [Methylomagnum ishizawai]SMF95745.1 Predicted PurR-regulated permease PerM [Methylomagnum ishizawai]